MLTFYLGTIFVFDTQKYKPITDCVFLINIVESFNLLLFSKSCTFVVSLTQGSIVNIQYTKAISCDTLTDRMVGYLTTSQKVSTVSNFSKFPQETKKQELQISQNSGN